MKNMQKLLLALFTAGLMTLTSCTLGSNNKLMTTPGVVEYSSGELRVVEDINIDTVWVAANKALKDLDLKIITSQKDKLAGQIMARRADDSKVVIHLLKGLKDVTQISIKAGNFGDENISQAIYGQIKANL